MGALFSVTLKANNFDSALRALGAKAAPAIARGLNLAATSERAAIASDIAKDMGLKVGTVKDVLRVQPATASQLTARVVAFGAQIPLVEFNPKGPEPSRGKGRGVSYRIGVQGPRRLPHAFIATMRSGHRGVFMRVGKSRLKIQEKHGPSIPHVFVNLVPLSESRRVDVLVKKVGHELSYALTQL